MRWNCELDLRSLKRTLQMEELRCKTPDMVHKEIWANLLAYNLIRDSGGYPFRHPAGLRWDGTD